MYITVIGVDHKSMDVSLREKLYLLEKEKGKLLGKVLSEKFLNGSIIINTCNRLEIYMCSDSQEISDKYIGSCIKWLAIEKDVEYQSLVKAFFRLKSKNAIEHLLRLSVGIESRIIGDEQIISQIREALFFSRERFCAGKYLGYLFEMAIACGKKVRSHKNRPRIDTSIVDFMINSFTVNDEYRFSDKTCLVVGDGCIGKSIAKKLLILGAKVSITTRNKNPIAINYPQGCNIVSYDERINSLNEVNIVFCATSSPNYVLTYEDFIKNDISKRMLCIDLAVPRDIDPLLCELDNVTLYNIDDFYTREEIQKGNEYKEYIMFSESIVKEYENDYYNWLYASKMSMVIQRISATASADVKWRMSKSLSKITYDDKLAIEDSLIISTSKMIKKLLFELRGEVDKEKYFECVMAMERITQSSFYGSLEDKCE